MSASTVSEPSRPRAALKRALPWLLLAAALGLWMVQAPAGSTLDEGVEAPALRAPWTEPGELDLAAERGHVTVLAFWATWCPACRQEGPVLSQVHSRIAPRGDRVIGVSVDRAGIGPVGEAARRLGMTYPIAVADREAADRFGVELLPTLYVIDAQGRVRASFTGAVSAERILAAVDEARDPEPLSLRGS